jgi:hypothetical protein
MTEKIEDYYECDRCEADNSTEKANSLNKRYCPCPRGSCEAELVGKVITTIKVIKNDRRKI